MLPGSGDDLEDVILCVDTILPRHIPRGIEKGPRKLCGKVECTRAGGRRLGPEEK